MSSADILNPGALSVEQLRRLFDAHIPVALNHDSHEAIRQSAQMVHRAAGGDAAIYGVNTGFGKLANQRIAQDDLAALQLNLLRSHAVGVGEPMPTRVTRLLMLLKAASLARGHSGVRQEVIDLLLAMYNANVLPVVPEQGSVGASGDLAPLAHLCLPLVGEGEVFMSGERMPAARGLARAGLAPICLQAKEGLALINGTQASTALALDALFGAERVFIAAVVAGALTLDAARGSDGPFDQRIHAVRGQPGQITAAAAYRELLAGSEIRRSHMEGDDRVQDPYCLRCQPQVMGACLDHIRHVARTLVIEANAVTDNPLVFADDNALVSGGNFHAEPVALACDSLAVAVAEVGAIAERRIAMLVDSAISRLPAFLTPNAGLHSGFMIAHVTAASLASENKSMAHPASVDSLPTSANQEDHVSMATFAARRLRPMLDNTAYIIAIELLAAAQGIEFLRPLRSSEPLERIIQLVREVSAAMMADRSLAQDMIAMQRRVLAGDLGHDGDGLWPALRALALS